MMNSIADNSLDPSFKKIVCRRIPVKLKQFARLLDEVTAKDIDAVRLKAMLSQISRTRETCEEYGVDSTAKLLAHIQSQLKLDSEALRSQVPLLKRFIQRLESHAERLQLGQINTGTDQTVREAREEQQTQAAETAPTESPALDQPQEAPQAEESPTELAAEEPVVIEEVEEVAQETVVEPPADLPDSEQNATPEIEQPEFDIAELDAAIPVIEANTTEELPTTTEAPLPQVEEVTPTPEELYQFHPSATSSAEAAPIALLEGASEITIYWCIADGMFSTMKKQLTDFGYPLETQHNVSEAIELSKSSSSHVVIAHLESLPDEIEAPLNQLSHFIVFAEHDTIENRLKGIRLGSTLFFSDPVDAVKLMEYLDTLEQNEDPSPYRVLVMEDSKAQAKYNDKVLSGAGFEACIVIEPMEILNALSNFDPEVILMDMQMPGCSGIELTQVLRQIDKYATTPILFLSAEENVEKQQAALICGGNAFIAKPVKKEQLLFMTELYARRSRSLRPYFAKDIQTGLISSAMFKEQLSIEAERAMRQNAMMILAFIQIDNLNELNKEYGYVFGERAMQQLARLLRQRLRKTDIIGLFDEDTIGIALNPCTEKDAEAVTTYLRQSFSHSPVSFEGQQISTSISVGLSKAGADYNILHLVKRSQAALNKAQTSGGNQIIWAYENQTG
ncbi:diguanylate cyclase domain-containing protein [Pleionea sp. CnH1-48]|uniref:GGDEF domain-containing response regulator n=1 Tax=Pleionea sp. CnH1-48 TaxID=2954494 RepID=UPI0020977C05|nr:diguanylate cyclase [Pleionea sp. CnH1-48]MCO7224653.1 diguanylate cyclase [Pleionea sp. CnH1-48]